MTRLRAFSYEQAHLLVNGFVHFPDCLQLDLPIGLLLVQFARV